MKRTLASHEIPTDVLEKSAAWQAKRRDFDAAEHSAVLAAIFRAVLAVPQGEWHERKSLQAILLRHPKGGSGLYSKANLVAGYRHLVAEGDIEADPLLEGRIRMKPMRTQSGVAPVTVLTAPRRLSRQVHLLPRRLAYAQELSL
jgi:elongator complex protein 3